MTATKHAIAIECRDTLAEASAKEHPRRQGRVLSANTCLVLVGLREDESELQACAEAVPCILEYFCPQTLRVCGDGTA